MSSRSSTSCFGTSEFAAAAASSSFCCSFFSSFWISSSFLPTVCSVSSYCVSGTAPKRRVQCKCARSQAALACFRQQDVDIRLLLRQHLCQRSHALLLLRTANCIRLLQLCLHLLLHMGKLKGVAFGRMRARIAVAAAGILPQVSNVAPIHLTQGNATQLRVQARHTQTGQRFQRIDLLLQLALHSLILL